MKKIKNEQVGGMGKFKGGASDLSDPAGPNRPVGKSTKEIHHKNVQQEAISTSTNSRLGPNRSRRKNTFKGSLDVGSRNWGGHQSQRKRYKTSMMKEEIIDKVIKKINSIKKEEKTEKPLGKTDTNSSSETITIEPAQKEVLKGQLK